MELDQVHAKAADSLRQMRECAQLLRRSAVMMEVTVGALKAAGRDITAFATVAEMIAADLGEAKVAMMGLLDAMEPPEK